MWGLIFIPDLARLGEAFRLRGAAKHRYGATSAGAARVGNPDDRKDWIPGYGRGGHPRDDSIEVLYLPQAVKILKNMVTTIRAT